MDLNFVKAKLNYYSFSESWDAQCDFQDDSWT